MLVAGFGSYFTSRLIDQGFANLMGLETLRHGPHPLAWLGIHIAGTIPQFNREDGNEKLTSRQYQLWWGGSEKVSDNAIFLTLYKIGLRIRPRYDSYNSTYKGLKSIRCPKCVAAPVAIAGIFVPPIRVRATAETASELLAADEKTRCISKGWISPLHIGTVGTAWNALTYKTPLRMIKNPMRVLTGVFQLALAASIAYTVYKGNPAYFAAHKSTLIAGTILGMV